MEKLRLAYESKGHHVSTSLRPGLSPDEIGAKTKWFPSSMPPELIALYKWHDGQEGGGWEVKYPFWIRDCVLSSLESAESEYKSIMESYGTFPEFPEDHEMLKHSFPFAAFNGGWMVFPCKGHNLNQAYERPIIFVLQGIEIFFYSIELMANTCIDWVQAGTSEDGEFRLDEDVEMEIWQKHNPGIFAG